MNRQKLLHGFDFYDNGVIDNEVHPVAATQLDAFQRLVHFDCRTNDLVREILFQQHVSVPPWFSSQSTCPQRIWTLCFSLLNAFAPRLAARCPR